MAVNPLRIVNEAKYLGVLLEAKYLGVLLDSKHNFNKYIDELSVRKQMEY